MKQITRLLIQNHLPGSLLLFFSLFCTNCTIRSVYVPLSQNTPLFSDQKELKGNAFLGDNHIELQGSFNPVNHLALQGNLNFGSGISTYNIGLGTYGYNANRNWRWEVLGGYGYNSNFAYQTANYNTLLGKNVNDYEVRSLYMDFYLQPGFGYFGSIKMYKLDYSFSLSTRASALYFFTYIYQEIDNAATQKTGQTVYIQNTNIKNSYLYALAPSLTNKVGIHNIYAVLQIQAITPFAGQADTRNTIVAPPFLVSLGFQYNFIFKKRTNAQEG